MESPQEEEEEEEEEEKEEKEKIILCNVDERLTNDFETLAVLSEKRIMRK